MTAASIFWIIISYLLGSIPFGFLIGLISGKNVLKVGWKKTSGSNVFKNVGKWQGIATGLLDAGKGWLAVYGAQLLGLDVNYQVLAGVAAVTGHNWSLFLKFSGGRGIGTFLGALAVLSLEIFGIVAVFLIAVALLWNAAIATILFLAILVYFYFYHPSFLILTEAKAGGLLAIDSLLPIFVKRLSPIMDIFRRDEKTEIILNRLIFDSEEGGKFRGKKIIKLAIKSFLFSPKFGWRATKFGAKIAGKSTKFVAGGMKKYVFGMGEKEVVEIKAEDFKKMMMASAKKIVSHQEEINRINVFPVADKDTGYNIAATLLGIEGLVSRKKYGTIRELANDIKEAAMVNARGNAGMILTGYMIEFLDRIKHLETIDAFHLAFAMQRGIKASRGAVANPVEGTILDVISAAGDKAFELMKDVKPVPYRKLKKENIIKILEESKKAAEIALAATPEKLAVLKQNNVVDAGGLGFVKILEAWIESLKGEIPAPKIETDFPAAELEIKENLKYPYEVVLSFKKPEEMDVEKIEEDLSLAGDSLEILEMEGLVKLHIHTDKPENVIDKFKSLPEFESQTENMSGEGETGKREPLGLVVDQAADLPRDFIEKYKIQEVPFSARFKNGEIVNSKEEIYEKIKESLEKGQGLPTTSAPSFRDFHLAYQAAFKKFEKFLVITVSAKLSGAYSSARIARSIYKKPDKLNIFVFDSFTAEAGEGLVAFYAQRLISEGKNTEEIIEELKNLCPRITLLACLEDFRYVVRGGRLKIPGIFVGPISFFQKTGIRPVVGLKNGRVKFFGVSLGKDIAKILAKEIRRQANGKKIKVAIAHADNLKSAQGLKNELEKNKEVEILFVSSASPVVAAHTGPGAVIAAFYNL